MENNQITRYWSRRVGKFVNSHTGEPAPEAVAADLPRFTGTIREWYEQLPEMMYAVAEAAAATGVDIEQVSVTVGSDALTMIECSVMYRPSWICPECKKTSTVDGNGIWNNRFVIKMDPRLPRFDIHVGDFGRVVVLDQSGI